MTITDERRKSVDFTHKYYYSPARLAMKKGSAVSEDFSQLVGKTVGTQRSTTTDRFATEVLEPKGVKVVRYSTQNEIYLDLLSGRLDAVLAGRLSDDMAIGLAGWRAKLRMRPVRDLLVASPLEGAFAPLWAFGVRQYRHIVTNSPGMWALATLGVAIQSVVWAWALGWGGWGAVAIGYGAAWGRALLRWRILRAVLEPGQMMSARRSLYWDAVAPFVPLWAHLAVQLQAATSNRIGWGGWTYRVERGRVTEMVRD